MLHLKVDKTARFHLSQEEKIALMEAKIKRAEAQVKALADLVELQESARGSKYPTRRSVD